MHEFAEIMPISAKTGDGVARLVDLAHARMLEGPVYFPEDVMTDQPMRVLAAELIREKILDKTRDELPFAVAVGIDSFQEEGRLARISATVYVEKKSQKAIVIGKQGAMLKAVGTYARIDMEHLFGMKVLLQHLNTAQEKRTIFELIKPDSAKAMVLSEMDEADIGDVLQDAPAADIAMLIKDLPDDDQAYVLTTLPEERSQEVLKLMKPEDSAEVKDLLRYEPKTAGAIMTTDFFSLPADTKAEEAIRRLQRATDTRNVFYVYVTNKDDKLVGVLSLRQLLLVPPDKTLGSMVKPDVISVTTDTDQEEVAKLVARYNLLAIPVVDKETRLVGIITVDDVVDIIHDAATEDMMKMSGTQIEEEEEIMHSSVFQAVRLRVPWLLTNLIGSMVSGSILWFFRYTIEEVVALVTFIPVIAA